MWKDLFQFIGGAALLIGAITYLSKVLIGHFFSKDLEKFKADLVVASERQKFTFEVLHAKRADVIKEVYKKIERTHFTFESLIKPLQEIGEPPADEKVANLIKAFNELAQYYRERRLYFEEDLAEKIDGLLKEFSQIWYQYKLVEDLQRDGKPITAGVSNMWKLFVDKVSIIKSEIEKQFRELIGM